MAKRDSTGDLVHPGTYVRRHVFPEGMTVTKAATLLGVGRPALSNFLNGKAALSQEMARRLEHAFGVDREDLLDLQARYARRDEAIGTPVVAGRHAPTLVEIKAHRIEQWANTKHAQEYLPALLRRLIHATGDKATRIDFPAFDNAQRPGWDGIIEAKTPTPWIPEGKSGWEFGCGRKPKKKACDDYSARVKSVPPEIRRGMTFVFVTPRNWRGKGDWAAEKVVLGDWKDVRVYDASDLEQWLEQSSETQVWFAERLDDPVSGFRSLDMCWSDWADICKPALSPLLFSVVEGSPSDLLHQWLDEPPRRPFIISADSPDEALAFACHHVWTVRSDADNPDASALVFDTPEAMRRFRASNTVPRVAIIHDTKVEKEIGDLHQRCHCVIVRSTNDVYGKRMPNIRLRLPSWKDFSEALKSMGLPDNRIDVLARESGRSPTILRRLLSEIHAVREPAWAENAETARKLLPAALVGAWHKASPADCEIVRCLARMTDDGDVENSVMELLNISDSPLWSTGKYRGVVSRVDALFGIAKFVTEQDINIFFRAAEHVLSEPDPALDLPEDERWRAAVHKKVRNHSPALRKGIRETLTLLSVHGDTLFRNRLGVDCEGRVSSLVQRLLDPLTPDKLLSHQDDLPDYAEAAPDIFLKLIEADLQKQDPVIFGLLKPAKSGPFDGCPRTGLLWALECLAWNKLGRASLILARLSEIAIDDNWTNKPIHSLEAIYRCWLPQTAASPVERLRSLETLIQKYPDIGWRICVAQLTTGSKVAFPNYRPHWRDDASGTDQGVTLSQCHEFELKALDLVLAWPSHDQRTLGDLVELLCDLPDESQVQIWDLIDVWADAGTDDKAKAGLRERIRRFAFTRCDPEGSIRGAGPDRARAAYDRLEPRDPVVRHSWLFTDSWIAFSADEIESGDLDHEKWTETVDRLRIEAMKEIWAKHGFKGLISLLSDCGAPDVVGRALEPNITDREARVDCVRQCLSVANHLDQKTERCIRGFLRAAADDTRDALLIEAAKGTDSNRIAQLYRCAPFRHDTWRLLDGYKQEVRDRYWQEVFPEWGHHNKAELAEAIDRLLEAKRPRAAFFFAHLNWSRVDTLQLKRLLFDIVAMDEESVDRYQPAAHQISDAFDELDDRNVVDRDEMARLEFMHVRALERSKRGIPNLECLISESPIDFVWMLALRFKRDDGRQDPPEWHIKNAEERRELGSAVHGLLRRITRIPGIGEKGKTDVEALSQWITEVRRLCAEYGRAMVGDNYIGEILSRAPADADGIWPCRAVCEAMGRVASEKIGSGFRIGTHNGRGVVSRSIGKGGAQERDLAEKYRSWAKERAPHYPYIGGILENIADDYERQALMEDDTEEIERRVGY